MLLVISLYNIYIFVWIQHFWGSPLNRLISELSRNETSYEEISRVDRKTGVSQMVVFPKT